MTGLMPIVLHLLPACVDRVLPAYSASTPLSADGEAYLGEEYLVPGSTPLHIAVMIGSVGIVHALLQVSAARWRKGAGAGAGG